MFKNETEIDSKLPNWKFSFRIQKIDAKLDHYMTKIGQKKYQK